jgi:predicted nucleic acid-binding protein
MRNRTGPLPVSNFLLLEFRQSTRLQVKLNSSDRKKGYAQAEANLMLADLESDLRKQILKIEVVDWAIVFQLAEELSETHTARGGHRLADLVHVATAVYLEKSEFLTFDANQRRLAKAAGLSIGVKQGNRTKETYRPNTTRKRVLSSADQ